ncbi:MAG: hypothetical protein GTO24_05620 [candidate division Zixibacteria bacterium]|nr:hypothetical protein [candidate division Zixibacteria bacterium]
MRRTSPAIVPVLLLSTIVIVVAYVASLSSVMASVRTGVRPSEQVIDRSDIIGVCVAESVYGEPPFTHENPPDLVVFKVATAVKGCNDGDILRVHEWLSEMSPPSVLLEMQSKYRHYNKLFEKWKEAPVAVPREGNPTLVFLKRSDGDSLVQYSDGGMPAFIQNPTEDEILWVTGVAALQMDISFACDTFAESSPIMVEGTITNVSKRQQTFDLRNAQISCSRNRASYQRPTIMKEVEGAWLPPPITLDPGESHQFEWDVRDILDMPRFIPGFYVVNLGVPAKVVTDRYRKPCRFWVEGRLTFEDAIRVSPVVFTGTIRKMVTSPDGTTKVRFNEYEHFKVGRTHGRVFFAWPQDHFPLPDKDDSLIVCLGGPAHFLDIEYVTKKSDKLVDSIGVLLGSTIVDVPYR